MTSNSPRAGLRQPVMAELAARLRAREDQLTVEIGEKRRAVSSAREDAAPGGHDIGDEAAADEATTLGVGEISRDEQELDQVVAALERIAAGNYGICAECDDPIGEARLRASPASTRCVACQQALEARAHRG